MALPGICGCGCPSVAEANNIPGVPGTNGLAGQNGYTTLTAVGGLLLPAVGALVATNPTVASSAWMTIGQFVVAGSTTINYAHFQVVSKPSPTTVELKFMGFPGDATPGAVLPAGTVVSPAGPWGLLDPLAVYVASGTGHTIDDTSGIVTIGATAVTLAITTPGTYLLSARARVDYWGATFADHELVTLKLRRTNNTAADVTNATAGLLTDTTTLADFTAGIVQLPIVKYATLLADDSISLQVDVHVLPSAGEIRVLQAEIVALRIY